MSIHDGHRQRIKERYLQDGIDSFADHEVLELLLSYAIPRCDTSEIAHNLINEFGSLHAVLDAPITSLKKIDGMGENSAILLSLMNNIHKRYELSKLGKHPILNSTDKQAKFCQALECNNRLETTYMICLNAKKKHLADYKLDEGNIENVPIYMSKIIQKALGTNAASILFTHNHPGGDPTPSENDIRATFQIIQALRTVDLKLEDHIIIGDNGTWVSLRESGCI